MKYIIYIAVFVIVFVLAKAIIRKLFSSDRKEE